ncbi:polysialyltransferase family glycosyltransferase [Demequina sp.]|uniref:polysialyltransferase family glycosyltransferase n=1 Tax=Demequina sp. TaxID=2050685 RepID=UPI003A8A7E42
MIQLTLVTTLFGAASAAAAVDAGLLGEADTRILVVANNAPIPEVSLPLTHSPGASAVLSRFDRVVDLGALLSPQRPARWVVQDIDVPMQEKLLRAAWDLGTAPVSLVLESVHVPPAATMAKIFLSAPITVLSEGLMSYGATRDAQTHEFGQRLDGLVHLDLVEGLSPLLLSEHGVQPRPIAPERFRAVIEQMCEAASMVPATDDAVVLVLGQYLAALGLVSSEEETAMQAAMIDAARDLGGRTVLFKPHPSAPASDLDTLRTHAAARGLEFTVADAAVSAEALMCTHRLVGVVAGFSTALSTAERVFGLATKAVGTEQVMKALTPYQNSNRIPLTIVDYRERHPHADPSELGRVCLAVAFTMQPRVLSARRAEVVDILQSWDATERSRYIRHTRLNSLGLPGANVPTGARRVAWQVLEAIPPSVSRPTYRALARANARLQRWKAGRERPSR